MRVTFENVTKRYGNTTAVRSLNLQIADGALHFLLGPSGCGKTTTLRMLAGLEKVTEGRILFDDRDVTNVPAAERGIGMVFQNYALWPHMTVRKNIEYGLRLRKLPPGELDKRVNEVLEFTQLTNFVDRLPGQLSGGQQQRVALARALAIRPNVLLLDEPLSNLDAKLRLEMRDNISRIHRQTGITTVYVTHDQKESLSMGTHISVMHAGDLVQTAPPKELYHSPDTPFIAGFIGETNLIDGTYLRQSSEGHVVKTSLGELTAGRTRRQFGNGDKVVLSVRPEAVLPKLDAAMQSPVSNQAGAGNLTAGTVRGVINQVELEVEHVTYLGESEQFQLQTLGTVSRQAIKANLFNPGLHQVKTGTRLQCLFHAEDLLVLPPEATMRPST